MFSKDFIVGSDVCNRLAGKSVVKVCLGGMSDVHSPEKFKKKKTYYTQQENDKKRALTSS